MLLHFILFLFVVCTAEICVFHSFYLLFLCVLRHLDFLLPAPLDACNNFSVPLLVVSLCMPQVRGTCWHLKGSYDSHLSCLNCSGCSRFKAGPTLLGNWLESVGRSAADRWEGRGSEREEAEGFLFQKLFEFKAWP